MHDWMVRRGQTFEYFKTDNNRKFWDVRCSAHNTQKCKFRIRVQECKGGKGKLSVFIPHTCRPSTHNNNKQARKVNLLASNEYSIAAVKADPKVAVKLLQANEKQARGTNPPYYAEFRAKGQIRQKEYGDETESFRKIPALLLAMQGNARGERGCYFDLDVDPTFKRFKRCWILPMATEQAFRHCRNFIASDGTFCTGQYKMTLLIVSTLDGNGQIIPITWCLCCGENKKNWSWFLRGIKTFLLGMTDDAVIISDRDKGLAGAVPKYFPYAAHGHCVFHIGQNVRNEHGTKLEGMTRSAAYAKTAASFKNSLKEIGKKKAEAQAYLENIDPTRWVLYAFPRPRYGHFTSNIQESVNKTWLPARDLPAVPLLGWIWNHVMNLFFERRGKTFKNNRLTDLATNWLEKEKGASATYRVLSSTMQRAVVEAPSGGQHIVEMDARTCTCLEFQDRKLPCKHAIAVCKEHNLEPEDYVSIIYSVEEYRSTYQGALPPVMMDVPLSDTCLAPFLGQKKKGRNKKKRIRREELVRKAIKKVVRCSLCKSPHHNKRTCDGSGLPVELNPVDSDASSEEDEEDEEDEDVEDVEDAEDAEEAEEDAEEDKDGPLYTWKEFSDPIEFESANSPQQTKEKEREHVSNMQSPTPILSPYVLPFTPPKSPQWDQISSENEDASGGEAIDPDDEIARLGAEEEAAEEGRQDEERALRLVLAEDLEEADLLKGLKEMDGYDTKHFGGLIQRHRMERERSPDRMAEDAWKKRIVLANQVWHRLTISNVRSSSAPVHLAHLGR